MRAPFRDAACVRGLLISPLNEGVARRKAQTYGVAILARTARAPLGAPVAASVRHRAALSATGTASNGLPEVSQLLAGPHSEPGRSPGAARVPISEIDPRAPRLVPPHDAS